MPVIAPPVGGPVEVVDHEINGYLMDSRCIEEIEGRIIELACRCRLNFLSLFIWSIACCFGGHGAMIGRLMSMLPFLMPVVRLGLGLKLFDLSLGV